MADFGFYLEDVLVEDCFLVGLLLGWLAWVGPEFFLDLIIRWEFKDIVQGRSPEVLNSNNNLSRLIFRLSRDIPKIPLIILQPALQILSLRKCQILNAQKQLLIGIQICVQGLVDMADLEVLP